MMGGYGFGMMGYGFLGWIINLLVIGIVVYYSTKLALKNHNKNCLYVIWNDSWSHSILVSMTLKKSLFLYARVNPLISYTPYRFKIIINWKASLSNFISHISHMRINCSSFRF